MGTNRAISIIGSLKYFIKSTFFLIDQKNKFAVINKIILKSENIYTQLDDNKKDKNSAQYHM